MVQDFAFCALPLFFVLAGFLFCQNLELTFDGFVGKLKNRLRTLFVPYVLWNLLTIGAFWIAGNVSGLRQIASSNAFADVPGTFGQIVWAVVGPDGYPFAYQFWFVRNLMVVLLLSPCWLPIVRRWPRLALCACGISWLVFPEDVWSFLPALCWIPVGAALAYDSRRWRLAPRHWLLLALAYALLVATDVPGLFLAANAPLVHHRITLALGAVLMWQAACSVDRFPRLAHALGFLSALSFFVYAAHEPLGSLLTKLIGVRLLSIGSSPVVTVFLIVGLCSTVCLLAGFAAAHCCPSVYSLLTGGRHAKLKNKEMIA